MYQAKWETSLASAVATAGDTLIYVASAAGFPIGAGPFDILVDSEVMQVTATSGANNTTWTVGAASTAQPRCLMRRARLSSCPAGEPRPSRQAQLTVASDSTGKTQYAYASSNT